MQPAIGEGDCASFEDASGVVSIALAAEGRCDVRFNRDLSGCVAVATVAGPNPGELRVAEPADDYGLSSFGGLDSDEIAVIYSTSGGVERITNRQEFSLAVFR